jgi:invasion protein IalB
MRYRFAAALAEVTVSLAAVAACSGNPQQQPRQAQPSAAPGCWTLRLSWGGHTDQLSLRYVR